jgi:hypothetical protein
MSEKKLKELNESIEKDIQEGKHEIFWILKSILFLGLISMIVVFIISIIRGI